MLIYPCLGIDYGSRKTGVAWSPDGVVMLPLSTINTDILLQELPIIIQDKHIKHLYIGDINPLPKHLETIISTLHIPYTMINERYTTKLIPRQYHKHHDISAQIILECAYNTITFNTQTR